MSDLTPARIAELRRIATGGYVSSYFDRDTILGLLDEIDRREAENERLRQERDALRASCKQLVSIVAGEFDCGGEVESIKRYQGEVNAARAAIAASEDKAAPESPDRRE